MRQGHGPDNIDSKGDLIPEEIARTSVGEAVYQASSRNRSIQDMTSTSFGKKQDSTKLVSRLTCIRMIAPLPMIAP